MMAAQSRQEKLLKNKIECLFTGRDDLCQLIGDYVNQVTKVGQSWVDPQANTGLTFNNVRNFLETSLNFLFDVVDKISVAATSPSSSSVSQQSAARSASPTLSMDASPSSSIEEQMESLRHRMDTLETRGHSLHHILSATRETVDKMEEKVDKAEEKVDKIEEKMDKIEEKVDKIEEKVDKREEKMDKMEEERAKRIQNLEERQKVMDEEKTVKTREMEKRLSQLEEGRVRMEKQIQSHEKTVSDLGMQVGGAAVGGDRQQAESRQQIGFKAQLPDGRKVPLGYKTTVRCLTEVTMNTGHHYDVSTGVFTVPVSGRYQVTLTHSQEKRGEARSITPLIVWHESGNDGIKEKVRNLVCHTGKLGSWYILDGSSKVQDSSEKVVQLGVGDRLSVEVHQYIHSFEKLVSPTCFSCVLLDN